LAFRWAFGFSGSAAGLALLALGTAVSVAASLVCGTVAESF
jgi:hypothetical protein